MFGRMKDPVEGVARLVSYVETNVQNEFEMTLIAQVIVEADGLAPTAVEIYPGVKPSHLPLPPGYEWRVKVDRANPRKVKIIDDSRERGQVAHEQGRAQAEQLAAAMRGEALPGTGAGPSAGTGAGAGAGVGAMFGGAATPFGPNIQVIGNVDSDQARAAIARVEQMLGVDLTGDGLVGGGPVGGGGAAAAAESADPLDKLERLAALRDQGVLTTGEFEQQKRKILGTG